MRFARLLATGLVLAVTLGLPRGLLTRASAHEHGLPLVRVYPRSETKATRPAFYSPTASPGGLLYFGNQLGVMEYDGRSWRIIEAPLPLVRSLTMGPDAALYMADEGAIGLVRQPDSAEPSYESLADQLPSTAKPLGLVRGAETWHGDVWFATDREVLRWQVATKAFEVRVFDGPARRTRLQVAGDRLWLYRAGEGLWEQAGGTWRLRSQAPGLRDADMLVVIAPAMARGDPVVGWPGGGLSHLRSDGSLVPWVTNADEILSRTRLLCGLRLADGGIALGTESEGLVLLSPDGELEQQVSREGGLPHATVASLLEDSQGAVWACTAGGPARVDWRSAATIFDHTHSGITDATPSDFARYAGTLYYLSADGLYRLIPSDDPRVPAHFERDERVPVQAGLVTLLAHPAGLLLASSKGLERLGPGGLELLSAVPDGIPSGLSASRVQPERVYFATHDGVGTGVFSPDGAWHDEGRVPGIEGECYDVIEAPDGVLWAGMVSRGVYRATRPSGSAYWKGPGVKVQRLTEADGLPKDHGLIFLWETSLGIHLDTAQGLYLYDPATGGATADTRLTAFDSRPMVLNPVAGGLPGEIWTNGLVNDPKTKEVPYPLLRLVVPPTGPAKAFPAPRDIHELFGGSGARQIFWEPGPDGHGVVWAKGDLCLVRVEAARLGRPEITRVPLIRTIEAEGRALDLPGYAAPGGASAGLHLHYSREPLTISFVSGLFGDPHFERFQTRLAGFNDRWSAPTARTEVTYTELEGGPFTFEVRTIDAHGQPSDPAKLVLTISPPWQRGTTAYVLYVLAGLGAIAGLLHWRGRQAERERRRLEGIVRQRTGELVEARDAAEAASRAKSTFLANMSHELRTPLNGIIGYAQVLMKERDLTPRHRERLRIVQTSGEHLLRMINEVLDFSKIEAGRMEAHPAPFHLPQFVRDIAASLAPRAEQKGLEARLDLSPDLPDLVLGDAQKLRQVLENLLGNAVKFTPRGRVELIVAPVSPASVGRNPTDGPDVSEEHVRFTVRDTGVGLSGADREKLFQPFQQAADGRPPEPGTGLGLAIAQRIATLLGGHITVESRPGAGSSFTFEVPLPALAQASPSPRANQQPIIGYDGPRRRLLVVDDVSVNRAIVVDLLAPLGFVVEQAASGDEAWLRIAPEARAAATPPQTLPWPDAVIMDLRMPGMDGLTLTRRLRGTAGGGRIKIIAMSASVLGFNRDDAFAAGCDDFVAKPFREAELLDTLGRHLGLVWTREPASGEGYAEANPPRRTSSAIPFATLATHLPAAALEQMLATARRGEVVVLRRHIEEARRDAPAEIALCDALESLARTYQMERIRELLERLLDEARPAE